MAAFLAAEANRGTKVSTIGRRLAAIRYAHKLAGHEPPTNSEAVKATMRGIRRTAGSAPVRKAPATADKVLAMVDKADTGIKGLRDRALRRLSARAVAELVKSYARRAGLKAADFSGHSLRSGFLTSAAAHGASIFKMMDVSRHKSIDTLRGYVRDAEIFRNHAGSGLL